MTKWGEKDLSSWDKFYALKIRQWKVVDRLIRESRRFGTSGATHGVFGTEIFSPRFEFFGGSPNVLPSRYPSYYFPFSAAAETKITGLD